MRIATSFIAQQASRDFQRAQIDLFTAQRQASSERKAFDLKGYAQDANQLISARSLLERANSYVTAGAEVTSRLSLQDIALGRTSDAADKLRVALTEAVGLDKGDEIMSNVELAFFDVLGGMETTFAGRYVFSGVRDDTSPVNVSDLAGLEAAATVDDIFENAPRRAQVQVDPNTTIDVAPLANDVSRDIFASLKRIKEFETANGAFAGKLTAAQRTFLEGELQQLSGIVDGLIGSQAANGAIQERAERLIQRQQDEREYLSGVVSDIQTADLAEVAARMSQAQLQLEASARVFSVLTQASVLNYI